MIAFPTTGSADELVKAYANLVESNSKAVSQFGARMVVLCKFVDAVLPELTDAQCRRVAPLFRHGVEDAMALTDDLAIPAAYQEALLEQTNILLAVLERKVQD